MIYDLEIKIGRKIVRTIKEIEGTTTLIGHLDDILTDFLFNDLIIKVTKVKNPSGGTRDG